MQFVTYGGDGKRKKVDKYFETESLAEEFKRKAEVQLELEEAGIEVTVGYALERFIKDREARGSGEQTCYQYQVAVARMFEMSTPLWLIRQRTCERRYDELVSDYAVATHRNTLAQVKTFMRWCVKQGWLHESPIENVEGVGKRNKGKEQLSTRKARIWYQTAMALAEEGDDGALGALCTLVMTLRASEVIRIRVRDLDDTEAPFDTLRLPDSKTTKGERSLEIPEDLRALFRAFARGKHESDWLFPSPRSKSGRHDRNWPNKQVQRMCKVSGVDNVCAQAMRGQNATIALDRGISGVIVADSLGHEDERTTRTSYAKPGAGEDAQRRRVLEILQGGKK